MDGSVVEGIADWSEGRLDDEGLRTVLRRAGSDIEGHRQGFAQAVADLNSLQVEACRAHVEFAEELFDALEDGLVLAGDALDTGDRAEMFSVGDEISRAAYQLNQTFADFRHHALAALGPTEIPNLNQLMALRDACLKEPGEESLGRLRDALEGERILAYEALQQLAQEPDLEEVGTLVNSFRSHLGALNRLVEELDQKGLATDFATHFTRLTSRYRELQGQLPRVQMALRGSGETPLPDINHLLKMIDALGESEIGEGPVLEALEGVEYSFQGTRERLQESLRVVESALLREECEATLATLELLFEGIGSIYDFLDERELDTLAQGREQILEFGYRFPEHQSRLREMEARRGQVTCPTCSTANPPSRTRCGQCGFPLPARVGQRHLSTFDSHEERALNDLVLHSNLSRIYVAINGVAEGTTDATELLREVRRLEALVYGTLERVPTEPAVADPDEADAILTRYDQLSDGADEMLAAFELLYHYLDHPEPSLLEQAVIKLDAGARMVAEAAG